MRIAMKLKLDRRMQLKLQAKLNLQMKMQMKVCEDWGDASPGCCQLRENPLSSSCHSPNSGICQRW